MAPSAYVDGKLGPAVGPDVLSVIRLDQSLKQMHASAVEVTNSVTGPPAAVAVTPDGRYAIVVDLTNPDKLKVIQQIDSYERAVSVAVNAAGTLVAAAFAPRGHVVQVPLVLYRFREGRLLAPSEPKLPRFTSDDELSDAEFLPGKDLLRVVYTSETYTSTAHPGLSLLQYAES